MKPVLNELIWLCLVIILAELSGYTGESEGFDFCWQKVLDGGPNAESH